MDYNKIIIVEPRLTRGTYGRTYRGDISTCRYIAFAMELLTSRYQRAGARDPERDIPGFFGDIVTYKRRVVKTRLGHVRGRYRDFGSLQRAVNRAAPLCDRVYSAKSRKTSQYVGIYTATRRVATPISRLEFKKLDFRADATSDAEWDINRQ